MGYNKNREGLLEKVHKYRYNYNIKVIKKYIKKEGEVILFKNRLFFYYIKEDQ